MPPPKPLTRLLHTRLSLPRADAADLARSICRRRARALWIIYTLPTAVFFAWVVLVVSPTLDVLGDRLREWAGRPLAFFLLLLLSYGVGIALACSTAIILQRRLLLTPTRRELDLPACLHCGYDLRGTPADNNALRCPECAQLTPVPRSPPAP